jgi:hypothetical protein
MPGAVTNIMFEVWKKEKKDTPKEVSLIRPDQGGAKAKQKNKKKAPNYYLQ